MKNVLPSLTGRRVPLITIKKTEQSLAALLFVALMALSIYDVTCRLSSDETPFVVSRQECPEPNSDLDAFR